MKVARLYYESAIKLWKEANEREDADNFSGGEADGVPQNSGRETLSNAIGQAISFNNLSVIELRQRNYAEASAAAKDALSCIEASLTEIMNKNSPMQLKNDSAFIENLMVLLVAYFNYGMCQLKAGMKPGPASLADSALRTLDEGLKSF